MTRTKNPLLRYRDNEHGTLSVEAVLLLPLLVFMFLAMFVLFDYFRAHSSADKTAYTLGDMISRETDYITPTYMDSAMSLISWMNQSATDQALRVSVVSFDVDADRLHVEWSQTRGAGMAQLTDEAVNAMRDQIPDMTGTRHMILVETRSTFDAAFDIGLIDTRIETLVTTMPRFAPRVLWQG